MFRSRISPSVLNRLLKQLIKDNFVCKLGGKYSLTEKGKNLVVLLEKIYKLINSFQLSSFVLLFTISNLKLLNSILNF